MELKNIHYEYKPVSLIKDGGEQVIILKLPRNVNSKGQSKYFFQTILKFSEEYSALNPKNEVPVLVIDNQILTQSVSSQK